MVFDLVEFFKGKVKPITKSPIKVKKNELIICTKKMETDKPYFVEFDDEKLVIIKTKDEKIKIFEVLIVSKLLIHIII